LSQIESANAAEFYKEQEKIKLLLLVSDWDILRVSFCACRMMEIPAGAGCGTRPATTKKHA